MAKTHKGLMVEMTCAICGGPWSFCSDSCGGCGASGTDIDRGWRPGMSLRGRCIGCAVVIGNEQSYRVPVQGQTWGRIVMVTMCSECYGGDREPGKIVDDPGGA